MYNLSLTACSFYLKKTNSKGNTQVFNLNTPFDIDLKDNSKYYFRDVRTIHCIF